MGNAMSLGLWDYVSLGISSGLVSAIITLGYTARKDKAEKERESSHGALEAAIALKRFAIECARTIEDGNAAISEANRDHDYSPLYEVKIPTFAFPESIVWKWFDKSLAAQLKVFPLAVSAASRHIGVSYQWAVDAFDVMTEKLVETAKLGQKAWELAVATREKYEFPPAILNECDNHCHEVFSTELAAYAAWQARRAEENQKMMLQAPQIPTSNPASRSA